MLRPLLLQTPAALLDQRRDRLITALAESRDHTGAIGLGAVLAHLPFALDARNGNLDADDGAHLHGDEILRRIADGPRLGTVHLAASREILDLPAQPAVVVHHARPAPDMHGGVIPGWHHLAGLALGRIPGRRHIILRALEHDQALLALLELAPLRIGARHVQAKRTLLRIGIEQEREKIGKKPGRARRDQQSERMLADQRMLNLWSVLAKGGRLVHGGFRSGSPLTGAHFPKSALHSCNTYRGLRKVVGTSKSMIPVPLSI